MICICWLGFPQYGARCVREFVHSTEEKVVVIATKPNVPIKGMDALAGCPVYWIPIDYNGSIRDVVGEMPRVITVPSWRFKAFDRFRKEVRLAGGVAMLMSDNNFVLTWRTIGKMILMRLGYRFLYDGYFVPGRSGAKLMRYFGVRDDQIYTGLYSADGALFRNGPKITERAKRILFVGSFNDNKNVMAICKAFLSVSADIRNGWQLEMCGCGPLKEDLPSDDAVLIHDFVQPEMLYKIYQGARCLVLASKFDHFGLVVHEATLSGCLLLLSNQVGAADDLLDETVNGFSFSPYSLEEMKMAMEKLMLMSDEEMEKGQVRSLELASKISLTSFANALTNFIAKLDRK